MAEQRFTSEDGQVVYYWPYCQTCHLPYDFDEELPLAYCNCGVTEWGYPRPAEWIPNPSEVKFKADVVDAATYTCTNCDGGPYDFDKVTDEDTIPERDEYYDTLDMCEGGSGMQVFEFIKRSDDKWYPIGFSDQDREYAGAYRDLLRRGEIPEGRPGMPRDSMG